MVFVSECYHISKLDKILYLTTTSTIREWSIIRPPKPSHWQSLENVDGQAIPNIKYIIYAIREWRKSAKLKELLKLILTENTIYIVTIIKIKDTKILKWKPSLNETGKKNSQKL